MAINVHSAFATPFGEARHADPQRLNTSLAELILELEGRGNDYRNPDPAVQQPVGLFESRFEFFGRTEPCVQELRAWCWGMLAEFIRNLNSSVAANPAGLQISSQTWFHVTRSGGYFGYHNHPMASWSGVYCVSDGSPAVDVENNGCLVFPHPMPAANSYLDSANSTLRWPYSQGNFVLKLTPGQLVLFPSWLGHYVTPFVGQAERITVAFNAWFARS